MSQRGVNKFTDCRWRTRRMRCALTDDAGVCFDLNQHSVILNSPPDPELQLKLFGERK
jgi:hypothetical protein